MHNWSVSATGRQYPLREPLRQAWIEAGIPQLPDGNNGEPLGFGEYTECWKDGKRQPANKVYDLTGVHVLTETLVSRVIIEGGRATGVQISDGTIIKAHKEVIVSAGAYRTPQVLLLSGIGPAEELEKHGIKVVHELPLVGRNLHDHLALPQWWKLKNPEKGLALGSPLLTDPSFFVGMPADWVASLTVPEEQMIAALRKDGFNELEAKEHHLVKPQRAHYEAVMAYAPQGGSFSSSVPVDGTHIGSAVMGLLPTSRGSVTLRSTNPADPPVIDPKYYSTEADRVAIRTGVRMVAKLLTQTPHGKQIIAGETPPDGFKTLGVDATDEEIDKRVAAGGGTFYHVGGTAAMGKVVDGSCRVMGLQGLRVVDASIIPEPIAAHCQAAVFALAEQAAEIIANGL